MTSTDSLGICSGFVVVVVGPAPFCDTRRRNTISNSTPPACCLAAPPVKCFGVLHGQFGDLLCRCVVLSFFGTDPVCNRRRRNIISNSTPTPCLVFRSLPSQMLRVAYDLHGQFGDLLCIVFFSLSLAPIQCAVETEETPCLTPTPRPPITPSSLARQMLR